MLVVIAAGIIFGGVLELFAIDSRLLIKSLVQSVTLGSIER